MSVALARVEHSGAGGRHGGPIFAERRSVGGANLRVIDPALLPMFASVRLMQPLAADDESFPKGSLGVVVEVLDGGNAYIVEFFEPRHGVMTVRRRMLVPE